MPSRPRKRKPTRRPRGTGSIFQRADGTWVGRVIVGRTPDKKPVYRELSAPTQAELLERIAQLKPPGPSTTVSEWAARWLSTLTQRSGTRRSYRQSIRDHILPALGHLRVAEVTPSAVEVLVAQLAPTHAVATIRRILRAASTMFRAAMRDGIISTNPVALAAKPRHRRPKIDPFTAAELAELIEVASRHRATRVLALMAATGCRIGEACALDLADWDEAAGTVSIHQTYTGREGLGPPKSEQGVRTIRVPVQALPAIRSAIGSRTEGPLFPSRTGTRRTTESVFLSWQSLIGHLGLRYRNPHQLRHSVATHLIAAGEPLGDVAAYLGDTPETVARTYLHATGRDVSAGLESLLGGGRKVDEAKPGSEKRPGKSGRT